MREFIDFLPKRRVILDSAANRSENVLTFFSIFCFVVLARSPVEWVATTCIARCLYASDHGEIIAPRQPQNSMHSTDRSTADSKVISAVVLLEIYGPPILVAHHSHPTIAAAPACCRYVARVHVRKEDQALVAVHPCYASSATHP